MKANKEIDQICEVILVHLDMTTHHALLTAPTQQVYSGVYLVSFVWVWHPFFSFTRKPYLMPVKRIRFVRFPVTCQNTGFYTLFFLDPCFCFHKAKFVFLQEQFEFTFSYIICFVSSVLCSSERPLHYQERVLPILHSIGADSHLLIKKHPDIEAMKVFLGKTRKAQICLAQSWHCPSHFTSLLNASFCLSANKVDVSKHGIMKFREERSILGLGLPSGNFHERYFILNVTSLRMYKDVRVRAVHSGQVCIVFTRHFFFTIL